jgi:hypothetical protein
MNWNWNPLLAAPLSHKNSFFLATTRANGMAKINKLNKF